MLYQGIIADTHVHLYPCYNYARALDAALTNMGSYAPINYARLLFLTERHDCSFFEKLLSGNITIDGWGHESVAQELLRLTNLAGLNLFLVAGRQIVTHEKLEVSALACNKLIPDGLSAEETVKMIIELGAVAVLPWGVGKWLFSRGKLVNKLVDKFHNQILIGDSSHRCFLWPEPINFKDYKKSGRTVLAGTDPLPLIGEELRIGQFGSVFPAPWDGTQQELLNMLKMGGQVATYGSRLNIEALSLQIRLRL